MATDLPKMAERSLTALMLTVLISMDLTPKASMPMGATKMVGTLMA